MGRVPQLSGSQVRTSASSQLRCFLCYKSEKDSNRDGVALTSCKCSRSPDLFLFCGKVVDSIVEYVVLDGHIARQYEVTPSKL